MSAKARSLFAILLFIAFFGVPGRAEEPTAEGTAMTWERGSYWTYDATRAYGKDAARAYSGPITIVILDGDVYLGMERWALAGMREWYDGSEFVSVFQIIGSPQDYLRWPALVEFLPRAQTTSSRSYLTYLTALTPLSPGGLPIRIERGSLYVGEPEMLPEEWRLDWLDEEAGSGFISEAITLIPGEPTELALSAGTFAGAIPVHYTWEITDRHTGQAWWVPELTWWAYAEGHEELSTGSWGYSYTIALSEWGVLTEEAMASRLGSALRSMEGSDPVAAEWIRALLSEQGFVIP